MKYFTVDDLIIEGHERVKTIRDAEIFLVIGGDGTMIEAVSFLSRHNAFHVKLFGINTGHVGFLSNDIDLEKAKDIITKLEGVFDAAYHKDWITTRSLIEIRSKMRTYYGINEVTIQPSHFGRLFIVDIAINKTVISYSGDGIIISTPSGSTAYNLSAGGPIIAPEMECVCITPLNPFSLASRSLVLPKETDIMILPRSDFPTISIDGWRTNLNKGKIKISTKEVSLIKINPFMADIQEKLGWNANIKN